VKLRHFAAVCAVSVGLLLPGLAAQEKETEQQNAGTPPATVEKSATLKPAEAPKNNDAQKETAPIITHHEIHVGGRVLHYTATTGLMPIRNSDNDEVEANIFFVAYTLDNAGPNRPLMFSFNGGPGSASIWLHMGAIGPRRVKMLPDGSMPPPPFELIDNQQTWLDQTDLVFIDPVGTGYSRASKKDLAKKFYGVKGDISSVGEFIRLYLSRYQRWTSPMFLVGESYGTTRAAGLSGYLIDKGVALSGVVLVSSVLNFQTLGFSSGNDLPYELYLPSYASTAWFHKKLPPDLQQKDLQSVLREAEQFASGPYASALGKGDNLSAQERQGIVDQLARLTGLDRNIIEENDLRVAQRTFSAELLRHKRKIVGRLDSRFTGPLSPVYLDVQQLCPRRSWLQDRSRIQRARRPPPVGLGIGGRWISRHQRFSARCVREESLHEVVRGIRLLRFGNTVLRHAVHTQPHESGTATASEDHARLLRGRTHDVLEK